MPAYFENGVFGAGERAWHGEGVVIPDDTFTVERAMELVPELASPIEMQQMFYRHPLTGEMTPIMMGDGEEAVARYCSVRQFDGRIVGDGLSHIYKPRQTVEKFDFLNALLGGGEQVARLHTAGTLQGGTIAWMLARLDGDMKIAGDNVARFLFCSDSFDGSSSTIVKFTRTRIVCANTLAMALSEATDTFKARHTGDLSEKLDIAADVLHLSDQYDAAYYEQAEALLAKQISARAFQRFLDRLIPLPVDASGALTTDRTATNRRTAREAVESILLHDDLANIKGTAWGVYNAVAEYEDWYKPTRSSAFGDADAQRFQRAVMAPPSSLKAQALALLVKA